MANTGSWSNGSDLDVLFVSEEQDKYEANTDEGYILLSRSFIESSLFAQDEPVLRLALYLMTRANWKPGKWFCKYSQREIVIDRGQTITSITKLSENIPKMSRKKVRLALQKLLLAGFVKDITPEPAKKANGYLMLRIEKYTIYQNRDNYLYKGQRTANGRTTNGQRTHTIEEGNTNNKGIYKLADSEESAAPSHKKRSAPNPEIKQFIDFWFQEYRHRFGHDPLINGEHGKLLQQILRKIPLDTLQKMAVFAFENEYTFLIDKGYPLKLFLSTSQLEEIRKDMRELGEL
jgi:hypothetical protein